MSIPARTPRRGPHRKTFTDAAVPRNRVGCQVWSARQTLHLIEAGYQIPTILITAYPDDLDHTRAMNHGVVCYLRKPVDEKHLMQCLRAALRSSEPREENS